MQRKDLAQGKRIIRTGRLPHALRATYEWTNPALCAGFLFLAFQRLHDADQLAFASTG